MPEYEISMQFRRFVISELLLNLTRWLLCLQCYYGTICLKPGRSFWSSMLAVLFATDVDLVSAAVEIGGN